MVRFSSLVAVSCAAHAAAAAGVASGVLMQPLARDATQPRWLSVRGGLVKSPVDLYDNAVALGEKKAASSPQKIAILSLISGAHIAFGGLLAVTVGGNLGGLLTTNPGLQKLIFGIFGLPFGLYCVLVCGGELFTGNTALVAAALVEGRATWKNLAKNWSVSWLGNLIGAVAVVKLITAAGLTSGPAFAAALAAKKVSMPFLTTFLRGIICNWMVCLAVWVATGCTSLMSKYLAIVLPVTAFVAFGAEHSIANMFFLPLGMAVGADISWADIFVKNLLPVTLGNIVGGAVCQAGLYSAAYGSLLKKL